MGAEINDIYWYESRKELVYLDPITAHIGSVSEFNVSMQTWAILAEDAHRLIEYKGEHTIETINLFSEEPYNMILDIDLGDLLWLLNLG